jgi:DNA-binding NarL/FixJ family response regulator
MRAGGAMASVLLIDDEALIRMMIADMLVELGHSVAGEANDVQGGLLLASAAGVDAAILDIQLLSPSRRRCKAEAFRLRLRAGMRRAACLKDFGIIPSFKSPSQSRSLNAA